MRLRTKVYEEKVSNTKKKPKKTIDKYKKSSTFDNMGSYDKSSIIKPLSKLEYRMITHCNVTELYIDDEKIPIENNWEEVVLTLLAFIFNKYSDNILNILAENEICTANLIISQVYGKYSFDGKNYKVLKVPNTDYYVESTFSEADIFNCIWGCIKALKINPKDISFFLVNPVIEEKEAKKILDSFDILNLNEVENEKRHLKQISYKDKIIKVHRLDSVLFLVIIEILSEYSDNILKDLCKLQGKTGIIHAVDECPLYERIPNTEYSVYTDLDNSSIIKFLIDTFNMLDIDINELKLYYVRN